MNILGIVNSMDGGAALMSDGRLVAAANEERFTRVKLDDAFPEQSIQYVLDFGGVRLDQVDVVAYAWGRELTEDDFLTAARRALKATADNPAAQEIVNERLLVAVQRDRVVKNSMKGWIAEQGLRDRFEVYDHHGGHAATAFYSSPFERALVVTLDARGNFISGSVSVAEGTQMTRVADSSMFDSLGFFYGAITSLLGFTPHRHEGKVTGLAAYGNAEACIGIMNEMIGLEDGQIVGNIGKYYKPFFTGHLPALSEALKPHKREDVAAAAQLHLEEVAAAYIYPFIQKYKIPNVCLSGGVFANVRLNMRIRELPGVENVYIHPQMGDGGLGVGAVALAMAQHDRPMERPLNDVYLGPSYSNEQIERVLSKHSLPYRPVEDNVGEAVRNLKEERVVGWFQGRMEYGPRALGARSILYHTRDRSANDWLNQRLNRTEFMPFAPVTTEKLAPRCFDGWQNNHLCARFMTMCYACTAEFRKGSPAVVHVDNTARPQIIYRSDNQDYYDVVARFCEETGDLALINTSFNAHEDPIVCSPDDAVKSLLDGNVDVLVIGDFVVERPNGRSGVL